MLSLPALASPPELPPEPPPDAAPLHLAIEPAPAPVEGPAPAPVPDPNLVDPNLVDPNLVDPNLVDPNLVDPNLVDPNLVVPAPTIEPTPASCVADSSRYVSKRPSVGTGLLAGGAAAITVATVMLVISTVGRNEAGLSPNLALPIGVSALPIAGIGVGAMISGIRANQKYSRWVAENGLQAPPSGNGMMATGVVLGVVGAISTGLAIDHNQGIANPDLGDRVLTGLAGATLASGVMLLGGGVIQRSRFAAWEGIGYMRPGVYAGRGGAGLTISGRF